MEMNEGNTAMYLAHTPRALLFMHILIGLAANGLWTSRCDLGSLPLYGGTLVRSYLVSTQGCCAVRKQGQSCRIQAREVILRGLGLWHLCLSLAGSKDQVSAACGKNKEVFFNRMLKIRQEKEHKPRLLGLDIFRWGWGLPREGVGVFHVKGSGPKSSVCPSKPRETKLLGGISRDFCWDIPWAP